ncbi:MAG: methyltransferase domain-containing protein [Sandaracinaceae bacterium]|nr:methyltransferase domain-containing protein [Sandaracinaceae bacterium]
MAWYDVFSNFYDASLEGLYRPFREAAASRLALAPGQLVLDAGCGTGQSLDVLSPAVGSSGRVVGVDLSAGMLARARSRAAQKGLDNVRLVEGSLLTLERAQLTEHLPSGRGFDRALAFLVMSALPEWETASARVWELVEPGGTMMIVDANTESIGLQGHLVNLMARADIRRRVWSHLERVSEGFVLERLAAPYSVGGDIVIARGTKPSR